MSQTKKPKRARKLKEGDLFFEVILRAGVRKEDLPAVLASAERWEDDKTDEERLLSAVLDLADHALEADDRVEFTSASAGTIETLEEFNSMRRMGGFARRLRRKKDPKLNRR